MFSNFQLFHLPHKQWNLKSRKCDSKTELPSDFSGNLLSMRTPRFPSLMQEEDVQIGHAWVDTIGGDAISMAYCLPCCPGLCAHGEDRRLCSSFPPHPTGFTKGDNTSSARNLPAAHVQYRLEQSTSSWDQYLIAKCALSQEENVY